MTGEDSEKRMEQCEGGIREGRLEVRLEGEGLHDLRGGESLIQESDDAAMSNIHNQISEKGQKKWDGNELQSADNVCMKIDKDKNEVKSDEGKETGDRVIYVREGVNVKSGIDEIENDGKHHENDEVSRNNKGERLEPVAPGKFSPATSGPYQKPNVSNDETGKEYVENFNPVADKFTRHIRTTLVVSFTAGIIISSLLSILNFTLAFIALSSTIGLSGGLALSEAIFLRTMEEIKA